LVDLDHDNKIVIIANIKQALYLLNVLVTEWFNGIEIFTMYLIID